MAVIPINSKTHGYHEVIVDEIYFSLLMRYVWYIVKSGKNFYAATNFQMGKTNKTIRLHQFLFPNSEVVDHINGNSLDNREENLRPCNQKQNTRNCRKRSNTSSIYRGVYKDGKNFRALIRHDGEDYYLGVYTTELAAATAYNKKAKELDPNFYRLNDIVEIENFLEYKSINKNPYKFVHFDKQRNKFRFCWRKNKIYKTFTTEEEAVKFAKEVLNG